ncbi:uncharacterized protein LOC134537733 isoform X2 [Bacillus rossius redtenbacheri]
MATCEDYEVQCPYNRSHMIRRSRIQQHIVKCERNYPGLQMEWCPHNASHRFAHHEDFLAHVPNCPDARISSNVLLLMAMKYHETGDMCKISCDPEKQVGADEDWSQEYADSSGSDSAPASAPPNAEVGGRRRDVYDDSRESEESGVGDTVCKLDSLHIDGEVSILDQIKPYSLEERADSPGSSRTGEVQVPVPRKACSIVEKHYLRGISIGRGLKLPWLDGKPGKSTYQQTLEVRGLIGEGAEKSVGRGFALKSRLSGQQAHNLRKPFSSYQSE